HILPGIDDGPTDLSVSLAMARCAVDDGIRITACTPHIYPGLYENHAEGIRSAIAAFRLALAEAQIPLQLVEGADTHLAPDLLAGIRAGRIPTLNGSRYFLFEPPHHVAPPRLEDSVFSLVAAGYVPIITHTERLTWIEEHYPAFQRMLQAGAWIQLTSGSLTGRYGPRPKYWSERILDEGLCHILATDAHHIDRRPPLLAEAREVASRRLGADEATHLVMTRPQGIIDNTPPAALPALPDAVVQKAARPFWRGLFGRKPH
ncbi:MAG: tyrosine-protein phosphatase, partial [Gammaproteobacteria bacterium]